MKLKTLITDFNRILLANTSLVIHFHMLHTFFKEKESNLFEACLLIQTKLQQLKKNLFNRTLLYYFDI